MKVFLEQSDFIDRDPRTVRDQNTKSFHQSYTVSEKIQTKRNYAMLPPNRIKGKRILDLGCCVAASGGWVLSHGASSYTGVEISPILAQISEENLNKYHQGKEWKIICSSIEDFLVNYNEHYDIILASGVFYAISDSMGTLTKMSKIADSSIVIEGMHPRRPHGFDAPQMPHELEFNYPYMVYRQTGMCHGDKDEDVKTIGFFHSIGAMTLMAKMIGFDRDLTVYTQLCTLLPDIYNSIKRYAITFNRVDESHPAIYSELINYEHKTIVPWSDNE